MRVLCDTSVLVPALWKWHGDHPLCVSWLAAAAASRVELMMAAHSLAETYSVVTRLPTKQRVVPADAWRVIEEDLLPYATLIDVPAAKYREVLSDLATRGIGGGVIYDAIIAAAADLAGVDRLLTMNTAHFELVWPQGIGRIVHPNSVTAP